MVKQTFWEIFIKKKKSPHFQEGNFYFILNRHILRSKQIGFEIAKICGGFG
jgi:hypothetical protein